MAPDEKSERNLEVVRSMYDAFQRGDTPLILSRLHPAVEWSGPNYEGLPFHGTRVGHAGAAEFLGLFAATLRITEFEVETFVASGSAVMTAGSWSGFAVTTGKPFASPWAMRFLFEDGLVRRFRGYQDTAIILAAITPDPA